MNINQVNLAYTLYYEDEGVLQLETKIVFILHIQEAF